MNVPSPPSRAATNADAGGRTEGAVVVDLGGRGGGVRLGEAAPFALAPYEVRVLETMPAP